jgi:hypothetical protein
MMGIMGFDFAWGLDKGPRGGDNWSQKSEFGHGRKGYQLHFLMNRGF